MQPLYIVTSFSWGEEWLLYMQVCICNIHLYMNDTAVSCTCLFHTAWWSPLVLDEVQSAGSTIQSELAADSAAAVLETWLQARPTWLCCSCFPKIKACKQCLYSDCVYQKSVGADMISLPHMTTLQTHCATLGLWCDAGGPCEYTRCLTKCSVLSDTQRQ